MSLPEAVGYSPAVEAWTVIEVTWRSIRRKDPLCQSGKSDDLGSSPKEQTFQGEQ